MTEAQAIEAMYEAWASSATGWPSMHPQMPYALGNEEFTPPAAPYPWARITLRHTVSNQITMGPPGSQKFERRGRIAVQLFAEVNKGDRQLARFADDVRSVFENKSLYVGAVTCGDYVRTYAGTTNEGNGSGSKDTDGRWAMRLVTFPFWYTETR